MPLVKPPTFEEQARQYGGAKEAVKKLHADGFGPDEIAKRHGLPYHLVQIWLADRDIEGQGSFEDIAEFYERMEVLRSAAGKETELMNFFASPRLSHELKVRFALGFEEEPLGVGEGSILKALGVASNLGVSKVVQLYHGYGDTADVARLALPETPDKTARLATDEVCEALTLLSALRNIDDRVKVLGSLLERATPIEAKYICRLALRDLKLGLHFQTVISAASRAFKIPAERLVEASNIVGIQDALVMACNPAQLAKVKLAPSIFLKPMLAHLYDPETPIEWRKPFRAEWKYDGARIQVHKLSSRVWLYSRRGIEKSRTLPEIVEHAQLLKTISCIADGEVVAADSEGRILPFQKLLNRVTKTIAEESDVQVALKLFDLIYLNGRSLTGTPLRMRLQQLEAMAPRELLVEGVECTSEGELSEFYSRAVERGLEGVMVKDLDARYKPAVRSWSWMKLRPERDCIDAVVVKALYGRGVRGGWFSSLKLAVREPSSKRLLTIGRVSSLPHETLAQLKPRMDGLKLREDDEGIWVKPQLIAEVTYQEIQESPDESSGYALRIPKFIRWREDKTVEDIDDLQKIRQLFNQQYNRHPLNELP